MLSVLLSQNADLLVAVADWDGDIPPTPKRLADRLGRDPDNTRKTALKLQEAGFVAYDQHAQILLTDHGRTFIPRLRVVSGQIEVDPDATAFLWRDLTPSPLNPRKNFDDAEIEALADLIVEAGKPDGDPILLEPLVVRPKAEGGAWIIAGARRHRAIGRLIERGEWPENRPIPASIRRVNDATARKLAIIENVARVQLNPFEEAQAIRDLMSDGMSLAEASAIVGNGKGRRWGEIRLQVDERASPIQKIELIKGVRTWREVLDAIQAHKPEAKAEPVEPGAPQEPTDDEVREATRPRQPGEGEDLSRAGRSAAKSAKAAGPVPETREAKAGRLSADLENEPGVLNAAYMAALQSYDLAIRNRLHDAGDLAEDMLEAIVWKAHGGSFFGSAESAKRLAMASAATPGQAPIWGQAGEYLIEVDNVRAVVQVRRWGGHTMALDFYAIDGDAPFFSNTGYRSHFLRAQPGVTLDSAIAGWLREHLATKDGKLKPIENCRSYADRYPWLDGGAPEQIDLEDAVASATPAADFQIVRDTDPVLECLRALADAAEDNARESWGGFMPTALQTAYDAARQFAPRAV